MKEYLDLLKFVLENGESHEDRTGVGTLSVFGYQFRHDMRTGFPLLTTKKIPLRWVAEELFWFLRGSTDEHQLEKVGVNIWREWATSEKCARFGRPPGDLGPIYGELWRKFPVGFLESERWKYGREVATNEVLFSDQISCLLNEIQSNPNSRRLIVSGWHPYYQMEVALPPCHTLWQIKVHPEKYMSLNLYARSIDSFLGLPFNIASYALLLTLIAACTGYEPKELIVSFGDLHIYKNHIPQVEEQLTRLPRTLPSLHVYPWWTEEPERPGEEMTPLERLLGFRYDHLSLLDYNPYPSIKAEVAV